MAVYYDKSRDAWVVDICDEWNRRRRKFLKSEAAARALEANLRQVINQAKSDLTRGTLPELRLSEAVTFFLAYLPGVPSTLSGNAQRLAALVKVIGDPEIKDITPALLADYQERRKQQVAPSTLGYEGAVIFRMFEFLKKQGHLQFNPAQKLMRQIPQRSTGRELTPAECDKLLAAVTHRIRLRLLLALDAGLRRGELMRLRRRDWQREEKLITVWRPKTRTSTTIPLTTRLQAALEEIAGHLAPDSVINSIAGRAVLKGTDFVTKVRARTSVPFRLHDLRHTFATRLRRVAPFETVRHLLGHAPGTMTERYIHPSLQDCREAIDRMAEKDLPSTGPTS